MNQMVCLLYAPSIPKRVLNLLYINSKKCSAHTPTRTAYRVNEPGDQTKWKDKYRNDLTKKKILEYNNGGKYTHTDINFYSYMVRCMEQTTKWWRFGMKRTFTTNQQMRYFK